jgi:formylglycine-generating enzyme required for sulfatase activity
MSNRYRAITTILLIALLLTGCQGARCTATPALLATDLTTSPAPATPGNTWVRPADGMIMVYVPSGTFLVGSTQAEIDAALQICQRNSGTGKCLRGWYENESPQHPVTLDAFWIDRTEVSNAQYRQCVESGHCAEVHCATNLDPKRDDQPAACLDWSHAVTYCDWAGVPRPTKAEWEYAARGPQAKTCALPAAQ